MSFNDLTGKVFGKLTVIKLDEERSTKQRKYWICRCECGNTISTRSDYLIGGKSVSCGCYRDSVLKENSFKKSHGMYGTRFYKIWDSMIGRCHRKSSTTYERYGGRGIKVCKRWREDFMNFYNDMYDSYCNHVRQYGEKDTTIERLDYNKNYCKSNCCWKTIEEQSYNKRNTIFIEGFNIKELSEKYNIPKIKIGNRYYYCKKNNIEINLKNVIGAII